VISLSEWLQLDDRTISGIVAPRVLTVAIYLNGTRRWFRSQSNRWNDYAKTTGLAHRQLCQLLYDHGIQTLIQPLLGYDLLDRGPDYVKMVVEQGLGELTKPAYRNWYHQAQIRVAFYGNWSNILSEMGYSEVKHLLKLVTETSVYSKHKLLCGAFADESLDNIVSMAKDVSRGEELLNRYYGQPVGPIDLIIGSGQPAIWDLPLLDINKASLYFLQAPTFCLSREILRKILYDHLYQRINDDELYDNLPAETWRRVEVLGIGRRTEKGWQAE
jgi:undecaprenyl pyrophosphate synthase